MTQDQARRVLGVDARAPREEIRVAYRAALLRAHPDQGGTDEMLRLVLEAWRILDDERPPRAAGMDRGELEPAAARLEITPVVAMVGGRVVTRLADGRRVTVTLKAGLRQGDKVRVKDTVLNIVIKGRRELFVSGDDLCIMVKTTPQVLLEGGRVTVKTPKGPKTFWVSKPANANHIVKIPGEGLPGNGKHKQGSLILKLVPERGPKESRLRARLRKFAGEWAA